MKFIDLTMDDIANQWAQRGQHFAQIVEGTGGRYMVSDMLHEIANGKRGIHGIDDGSMTLVAEIRYYPRKKALHIVGLAGERMSEWLEIARQGVLDLAARHEVDIIETQGRSGWERLIDGRAQKNGYFFEREV